MNIKNIRSQSENDASSVHLIEMLFRSYYKPLCKFIYQITRNAEQAEDVAQDVFMKLWQKREQLDEGLSIKSYLYKSAYNTALNLVNREKKKQVMDDEDHLNRADQSQADSNLNYEEIQTEINKAIESLPLKCKTVFLLSRKEELSNKEIAKVMDISIKTVENQMTKALSTLRKELQPYMDYLLVLNFLLALNSI